MGTAWFAANAKGIPYDIWWLVWGLVAFVVAPLMISGVVARRPKGQRGLILLIVPIPALLGVVIVSIATSCHGFGLYAPQGCDPSSAIVRGWLAVGVVTAAFIGIGVMLGRSGDSARDDHP